MEPIAGWPEDKQELMGRNVPKTIMDKVQKEHVVWTERGKAFSDSHKTV